MSDLEETPAPPPEPEPDPAPAVGTVTTLTSTTASTAPDPRDGVIADLQQQNEQLRGQVADLTALLHGGPQAPPATSPPPALVSDGSDRVQTLVAQGLSQQDAEQQAAYEAKLAADQRQPPPAA